MAAEEEDDDWQAPDIEVEKEEIPSCPFSRDELGTCVKVLQAVSASPTLMEHPELKEIRKVLVPMLQDLRGKMFRGLGVDEHQASLRVKAEKNTRLQQQRNHDKHFVQKRALRQARIDRLQELIQGDGVMRIADGPVKTAPHMHMLEDAQDPEETAQDEEVFSPRSCYTCKQRFRVLHHFYSDLCPPCSSLNWTKRHQTADLSGRVALVTGARVKIGFQTTLKLLRCGADVIATTRFPVDAALRFAAEADYGVWSARLHIHGLDFRDLAGLEAFAMWMLSSQSRLDILINNACQTVRRPPAYYAHLMDAERTDVAKLPDAVRATVEHAASDYRKMIEDQSMMAAPDPTDSSSSLSTATPVYQTQGTAGAAAAMSAELSQVPLVAGDERQDTTAFPEAAMDAHAQQVDLRIKHSWVLKLHEVPTPEVIEVLAINSVAPYILIGRLKPLMMRSPEPVRFIVNVSAMEGQFYRGNKSDFHPHTNMAKAALNMMTRTSAREFSECGIYMNAVDTGWINDEKPVQLAAAHAANTGWQTPIDEIDAAARILDPVFIGINEQRLPFGLFFKDYQETQW